MDLSYILNELGEDPEQYFGAISPPITQASNFAFSSVASMRAALADEYAHYLYSRGKNPVADILRQKLAALDGAEDALLFNSGASAIFAAVMPNLQQGDHVVSVAHPYTWAAKLFSDILPRYGITVTYVDGRTVEAFERAILPHTKLIYLESPNSWDFAIQDLAAVAELAKAEGIITVLDNSYCTPLYQQPIALGIDLVLQSATKYLSGHSDTVGGVLSGSKERLAKLFGLDYLAIGSGMTPFHAWLTLRGLRTLPLRLQQTSSTAMQVIHWLKQHPRIEQIWYPLDPSFDQYELASQQMQGAGGLFSLALRKVDRIDIERFVESLQHIRLAVSWGGHESLIIPRCAGIPASEFQPNEINHRMCRIYVGLESADYLIADLEQALNTL